METDSSDPGQKTASAAYFVPIVAPMRMLAPIGTKVQIVIIISILRLALVQILKIRVSRRPFPRPDDPIMRGGIQDARFA